MSTDRNEEATRLPTKSALRTPELRDLWASGDKASAASALAEMIAHRPNDLRLREDQFRIGIAKGSDRWARAAIDAVSMIDEGSASSRLALLRTALIADRNDLAGEIALASQSWWQDSRPLAVLSMKALTRSGHDADALKAAFEAARKMRMQTEPDEGFFDALRDVAAFLDKERRITTLEEIFAQLLPLDLSDPNQAECQLIYAKARLRINKGLKETLALLEACKRAMPEDPRVRIALAECHISLNDLRAAQAELQGLDGEATELTVLNLSARIEEGLENHELAAEALCLLLDKHPGNQSIRRRLIGALVRSGYDASAYDTYRRGLALRTERLPASFAAGVADIEARPAPHLIPSYRTDWLEQKLGNLPFGWRDDANRSVAIEDLLVDWLECKEEQREEVLPFFEIDPEARAMLHEASSKGNGVLIAAAHASMLFAGPVSFSILDWPAKWVASTPLLSDNPDALGLISTETGTLSKIGKKILNGLRDGLTIAVAVDGHASGKDQVVTLLGDEIHISGAVASLVYRRGVPSFFPSMVWSHGRCWTTMQPLPEPDKNEPMDVFVARWSDSFARALENLLREHPSALRGKGGFWQEIGL